MSVSDAERNRRFEASVLPLLPAAYNTARWLTGNRADAEDVVQEAYLRALRYFAGYRGGDARAWLLRIVRNCARDWLAANRTGRHVPLEEGLAETAVANHDSNPEAAAQSDSVTRAIRAAVAALAPDHREVLVLREFAGLSYRDIAGIVEAPIGTVMSRLSRARDELARSVRAIPGGPP